MTNNTRTAWRLLTLLVSVVAMSALLLAAACGGDDDDDDDDDGGTTATATADNGDGNGDGDGPTDAPDDGDDNGGDDPLADLEDIAGEYEAATGVVTYTFSDETGDSGTWTIYTDGPNSRVDGESYISITTPEESYTCTESEGTGFCFEGAGGIGANPFAGLFGNFASSEAVFRYLALFSDVDADASTENIAGIEARCYALAGDFDGDSGTIKWCFAANGLLLLAQYQLDSGNFEMRATEASDSVPGDAFDPPYEVTPLGQ